jgi:RNA polymerase sigma-70 factor (ECF subfamily)
MSTTPSRPGAAPTSQDEAAAQFQALRPRLLGIAYRLLGSMWDAEDVVAEAAVRWLKTDRTRVEEPAAFLTTVVSRLALDHLRSARVRRESYTGPWLPEPVATPTTQLDPLETAEARESLSMATLLMMERLTPPERAVLVLRSAFDLPYDEIAAILDVSATNARQLHVRARAKVNDGERARFEADPAAHRELLELLLRAAESGDLGELEQVLATDVVVYGDGGGRVRAALRPVTGKDKVMRFFAGLVRQYPVDSVSRIEVNGVPAAVLTASGLIQLLTFSMRDGQISEIYVVMNPDKLAHALGEPVAVADEWLPRGRVDRRG